MTRAYLKGKRVTSDASRALMRDSALERGKARSQDVEKRVRDVMNGIDEEMARNGGVYPHNGGAVSAAEVARRAGIHETTFYTAKQRDLGKEVKAWISGLKATNVVGRVRLRRTVAERLQEWMENYKGLAQSHRDTELELQQVEADRDAALVELERLRNENATLRENLSVSAAGRVVGFPPQNR